MRKDSTIRMTRQLSQYHVSLLSYFKNLVYSINCVFSSETPRSLQSVETGLAGVILCSALGLA